MNAEKLRADFLAAWRDFFDKPHRERALARMQQVLGKQVATLGENHPETVTSLDRLAFVVRVKGKQGRVSHRKQRYALALTYIERAVSAGATVYALDPAERALIHHHAAFPAAACGDMALAVRRQTEGIALMERSGDAKKMNIWLPTFYSNLGYWQREDGQLEPAIASLHKAISMSAASKKPNPYLLQDSYQWLGEAYKRLGKRIAEEQKKAQQAQKEKPTT